MTEIEQLRAEVAKLREEIAALKLGRGEVHYHYHGQQPSLLPQGQPYPGYPPTHYPAYRPSWSGGQAVGIGQSLINEAKQ